VIAVVLETPVSASPSGTQRRPAAPTHMRCERSLGLLLRVVVMKEPVWPLLSAVLASHPCRAGFRAFAVETYHQFLSSDNDSANTGANANANAHADPELLDCGIT